MRWITTMLALAVALALAGMAGASDVLDGTYVLDPKAGDDPTEVMKQLGMSPAEIAGAKKIRTRMTIDGEAEQVTITLSSKLGKVTSVLPTDGSIVELGGKGLGSGQAKANWQESDTKLMVVSESTTPDGKVVHTATTRYLEDDNTLIQQFDVSIESAEPVTVKRVFRRKK